MGGRGRETRYYLLPESFALVNAFFQGDRRFDPALYRNRTLGGRPVVNTRWDLIFDTRGELVNRDVDLQRLTDIRLYVVYEDETIE